MDHHYNKGMMGVISVVHRSGGEMSVDWTIPGFLDLPSGDRDFYESPRFGFCNARWYLSVWPNKSGLEFQDEVDFSLHTVDDDGDLSARTVIFSLGVRGFGGGVEKRREEEQEFEKDDWWSMHDICSRSELSEQKERLMPGGALTIVCLMKVPGTAVGGGSNDDDEDEADSNSSKRKKISEQQNPERNAEKSIQKLLEDLGKVLASGENSDVVVRVGEQEFQVHRVILFARCPALSISLWHESAERGSNRIVVEDIEPDTFRDFLHFLYTGSIQSLTKENAFALYRIADRYLVDDLKRLCLEQVQNAMSVDTFCDAVRLAKTHGENGLMDQAVAFAAQNIQSILSSEEWRNFNRECPDEANEVLLKFVVPPSKRQKTSR